MDVLNLTDEQLLQLIEKNCVESGISEEEKINSIIVWAEKTLLNATYLSLLNKQVIRIAGVDSLKEPIFESNEKNHLLRNSFSTKR
jgi:hypothetical protein